MKSHFMNLLLLLLTINLSSAWGQNHNPQINTVCQKTRYYSICVNALQYDPRSGNADVKTLGLIMLDSVTVKANETLHHIGVAYAKAFSPVLLRNYGNCILSYDRAVTTDLKAVTGALKSGAYATAVNGLKNVIESDYNSCEQQFGPPPTKWEFSNETSYILKLTLIAISIIQTLG
ncbi:hypothetical protein QQ045_003071 [Rhodiola kirilowii]